MGWGGHCHEGRREVLGLHTLQGQAVHVGGVHILVVVPAEAIEGDQQQLVEALPPAGGMAAGPAQQGRQQQCEGPELRHTVSTSRTPRRVHRPTPISPFFLSMVEQSPD